VVQQRAGVQLKGGVGEVGDRYERHADDVADRVVQGKSAESLLDQFAGGGAAASASHVQQMSSGVVQRAWSQTADKIQKTSHGGVNSDYTATINIVDIHIAAGANDVASGKNLIRDFLLALREARNAIAAGQSRAPGGLNLQPAGAQVLKMTMELLGKGLGDPERLAVAESAQKARKDNATPITAGNDALDPTIAPEHQAFRNSLVGAPGVTMSPIGGQTTGGTVDMLTDDQAGRAERQRYDRSIDELTQLMSLRVTVDLAALGRIITMMESSLSWAEKIALTMRS
jgi:hypothetical protein